MCLAGISGIEVGYAFVMEYMQKHNDQFAVSAASEENAHRPAIHSEKELGLIFSIHHKRKVTKNLSLQPTTHGADRTPLSSKSVNSILPYKKILLIYNQKKRLLMIESLNIHENDLFYTYRYSR